jgi:hypothetical protein
MPLRARRGLLSRSSKLLLLAFAQTDTSTQRAGEKRQSKFLFCLCLFVALFLTGQCMS